MPQYVIQIQITATFEHAVGWLVKSFEVSAECPIPVIVPPERVQVIMTNTDSFNSIEAVYAQYTIAAIFADNPPNIDVSGPVTDSWPID